MITTELLKGIKELDANGCSNEEQIQSQIKLINQFKSELCKAQRENCANIFYENKQLPYNLKMAVLNAIEPQ